MKRCPYCAEEIQSDAVICRYCSRRVKGRHNRAIAIAVIVIMLFFVMQKHKADIRVFTRGVRSFFSDVCVIAKGLPEGLRALSECNKRAQQVEQVMNNKVKISE